MNVGLSTPCPLCKTLNSDVPFYCGKNRPFYKCDHCNLIYVLPEAHLLPDKEKARYDGHENSSGDLQYRKYLNKLALPMLNRLDSGQSGLDFGSGPGPTLHLMFEEAGHTMSIYDVYYAPDASVLDKAYEFVSATEVVEHLYTPRETLDKLWECVKPGGLMGVMTQFPQPDFGNWRYKNDLTHVCFFSPATFAYMGARWEADLIYAVQDVVIFRKS